MRDMNLVQQDQARRKSIIIQKAREGYTIGEQATLAGIDRRSHQDYRNDDPVFRAAWQQATDEANVKILESKRMASGRRRQRAEMAAIGAHAQLKVVAKMFSLEGQVAPTADLEAQAKEDPQGFAVKAAMAAKVADDLDARAFKLDEKENTEETTAAITSASSEPLVVRDCETFLRDDLARVEKDEHGQAKVVPFAREAIYNRVVFVFRTIDDRADVRRAFLVVGKGAGKGYVCSLSLARPLQRLLSMPAEDLSYVYRCGPRPRVGVINLSGSGGEQAELAVFTDLRRWLDGAWFRAFGKPTRDTAALIEWELTDRVVCAMCGNSRSEGAEGIHFVAAAADEVCRLPEEQHGKVLSADALVSPVEATMLTRSGTAYKLVVASWPDHQGDYLHLEVEKARKSGIKEDLTAAFLAVPLTCGDAIVEQVRRDAFAGEPFNSFPTEMFVTNDGTLVVWCPLWEMRPDADPVALREFFTREPVKFAAMVGARPVIQGQFPFFRDPAVVRQHANPNRAHPVGPDGRFLDWFRGSPEFLYYAHLDGAIGKPGGDAAGICVAHWDQGRVIIDLMLEMRGPGGGELQLEELRQVLYAMAARGFTFAGATCDGFEGFSMRQELNAHGVPAEHLSVDRTREPYEDMRDAVQTDKADYYAYEPFFECCDSLVDTGKKVDHTAKGKKDVSDAVAGVVHVLVKAFGHGQTIGQIVA